MTAFATPIAVGCTTTPARAAVTRRSDTSRVSVSRSTASRSARRQGWRMCEQKASASETSEAAPERPPEPYPGFYNDMRRAGVSDEQAIIQAAKVEQRKTPLEGAKVGGNKSLLGADGKPLAPWMNVPAEYDKSIFQSSNKNNAKGRLAGDPQQQELSGQGLTWKRMGDELLLTWATGSEEGTKGFIVTRRKGQTEEWATVSDWRDKPAELASKGPNGGSYSFVVNDVSPGTWVYRVSDENDSGTISDLSQTLVEFESDEDTKVRLIALVALLGILAGFIAFGLATDPLSGTS